MEIKIEATDATRAYAVYITDRLHFAELVAAFASKQDAIDYVDEYIQDGWYPPSRWNSTVEESDGKWMLTMFPTKGYECMSTMIYVIEEKTLI